MKNYIVKLKALLASNDGAVLPLIGLSFAVLVLASGFTIDYSRAQIVKERMQWAVDAAALAAAKASPQGQAAVQRAATAYFRANFPNGYMGTSGGGVNARLSQTAQGYSVKLDVTNVKMKSYIVNAVGMSDFKVDASAVVNTLPLSPLDVLVAIDASGSMLWRDDTGGTCLFAGGTCAVGDVDCPSRAGFCRSGTSRLAAARGPIRDLRDMLHSNNNRFGVVSWSHITRRTDGVYRSGSNSRNCPYYNTLAQCDAEYHLDPIMNLTTNRNAFNNRINNLRIGGNTDHANGMYWAYQTMRNSNRLNRSIVFITDGWPTMDYRRYSAVFGTDTALQQSLLNQFVSLCQTARNNGINVYTVVFNLNRGGGSRQNMVYSAMDRCTGDPNKVFDSRNARDLARDLRTIGTSLMTMRLTD